MKNNADAIIFYTDICSENVTNIPYPTRETAYAVFSCGSSNVNVLRKVEFMEFNELVNARRSVRAYDSSKKVTADVVKEVVKAAILAPSWKNSQTARYYAVVSDDMREKFAKECLPEFNAKNSSGAALIVTTFVHNRSGFERDGSPTNEVGNGWGFYDLGMHNENFVLKAKDMGLDTLVMGIRDEVKIREMLEIPETETVVAVIALGYGTVNPDKPKRKEPEDIVRVF